MGGLAVRLGVLRRPTITAQSLRSGVHRERLRAQVLQAHRMGDQLRHDHSPDPEIGHRMAVPAAAPSPGLHTAADLGASVDTVSGGR